jgi:hypothetical protein
MPEMQPVGNTIIPPNPQQGLNTLSSIIGIQQQKQNLQTGQYAQGTAQAGMIQAQQAAKETQAGAKLLADPVGNGLIDEDGNPTKNAQGIIMQAMPTTGNKHYQDIVNAAQTKVNFQNAVQNLSQNEQGYAASYFAGVAADPAAHVSDVTDSIKRFKQQFAGTAQEKDANKMADVMQNAVDTVGDKHGMDGVRKVINGFSRSALGNQAITGAGGVSAPQNATMDTGAQIQPGTTAPALQGGGFTPGGPPITKTPASTVTTNAAGQLVRVAPGGAGLPTAGSPGGGNAPIGSLPTNPSTAQAQSQNAAAAGVTGRVQQAQSAANQTVQAQDALMRARNILDNPGAPNTGAGFEAAKGMKNLLAGIGVDTQGAEDMNSLVKNLARYEASRATQAGLGGTDAARELAHTGSPNTQIDRGALKGIVTQSLATEKALAAYASVQSKSTDPNRLIAKENEFRNIPNLVEGYEYGLARTPQEADEFLKKHGLNAQQMAQTRQQIKAFETQ